MFYRYLLLIALINSTFCLAQDENVSQEIEQYQKVIASSAHDSLKIKAIKAWNQLTYMSDPALDLKLNKQIDSICENNLKTELSPATNRFFMKEKAAATNIIGVNYYYKNELEKALIYYQRCFNIQKELGNQKGQATAIGNVGVVYFRMNKYDAALDYYMQGLELHMAVNDSVGIAGSYRNISTVYQEKGDYYTAIEYLNKEKQLNQLNKDSVSLATSYMAIGVINFDLKMHEVAKKYFLLATDILERKNAQRELPRAYNALGACYTETDKPDSAIYYLDLSLAVATDLNDSYLIAQTLMNKARIQFELGKDVLAEQLTRESLQKCKEIGYQSGQVVSLVALAEIMNERGKHSEAQLYTQQLLELVGRIEMDIDLKMDVYGVIYTTAKGLGDFKNALTYHELHVIFRDSLLNNENQKLILQNEFKSQLQADSIKTSEFIKVKDAELKAEKSENDRRKQQGYYLLGGLALTVFFGLFVLNRYRFTRRQNLMIAAQKKAVVAAHEEIRDSISYAKRIQSALLPPMSLVQQHLADAFILYLPKDVVAGDFYWLEQIGEKSILAAADCTGHGVPGAMVSVLCSNALSRSTREYGLTEPGKVLNKTRDIIIEQFAQSEENVNDGMDIALVTIEPIDGAKKRIQYAGANNPLWILRKGSEEIEEIKASKQPVGNYAVHKDFDTTVIDLEEGDQFYIFSDGFADQFGGDKGKKMKNKSFKDLLIGCRALPPKEQQAVLKNEFHQWRGSLEQIDDVLVIGVRV